ncbi:MAG: arylesterase [Pseudomonadota bacterium]
MHQAPRTRSIVKNAASAFPRRALVWLMAGLAALALAGQTARAETVTIMALGDSLTAGFGLAPGEGFPAQLEQALLDAGYDIEVIDAGVSGDTTTGGLARLDWALTPETDAVIVELGGNDALRGIDPGVTEQSLDGILASLQDRELPTLLTGMLAPPNMGAAYGERFNPIYGRLAEQYETVFYPFFLDGVAAEPDLNLPDGIHPTAEGIGLIVERILPYVEDLILRVETQS